MTKIYFRLEAIDANAQSEADNKTSGGSGGAATMKNWEAEDENGWV
jgi:hypothetical protein